jgi:hypothetical protein
MADFPKKKRCTPEYRSSPYRVFVSYCGKDCALAQQVVAIIRSNGLEPLWAEDIQDGYHFLQKIHNFIAHSHIFLPVLTDLAKRRNWVNQEIGYALALKIPVLPVTFGVSPGEMISEIKAISLSRDGVEELRKKLTASKIAALIEAHCKPSDALYECAEYPIDRAKAIVRYCDDVRALGEHGHVRQRGGLSSFHIPSREHDVSWGRRYKTSFEPSKVHMSVALEERLALARHANVEGCKLIVICPKLAYTDHQKEARCTRLQNLREFLVEMDDYKCQIVGGEIEHSDNTLIIGNWFMAESLSLHREERQTVFTRHYQTVTKKIDAFDNEFKTFLEQSGIAPEDSRRRFIRLLDAEIRSLRKK